MSKKATKATAGEAAAKSKKQPVKDLSLKAKGASKIKGGYTPHGLIPLGHIYIG